MRTVQNNTMVAVFNERAADEGCAEVEVDIVSEGKSTCRVRIPSRVALSWAMKLKAAAANADSAVARRAKGTVS